MADQIGTLFAQVIADQSGFRSDMAEMARTVQSTTARMNANLARIGKVSQSLSGSFRLLTRVAAGFGVVLSARAIGRWIKDAIELDKLTKDQALSIGRASKAVADLNNQFQNLARKIATSLAPELERIVKFWDAILFPRSSSFGAQADALREQVAAQIAEVERLQRLLTTQSNYSTNANWLQRMLFGEGKDNIAETTGLLAEARAELERLRAALLAAQEAGAGTALSDGLSEIIVPDRIRMPPDLLKFDFAAAQAAVLNSELQEFRDVVVKMPDEFRKWPQELVTFEQELQKSAEKLVDIKDEGAKAAEFLGESFRDAFSDWILGTERSFRDMLKRMAIEMATSALFQGLASFFPGGSFLSGFFGGGRAEGGPVSRGKAYVVGEKGPEWFLPGQDGAIAPMGGGLVINSSPTFNFSGGTSHEQAAAFNSMLNERDRRLMANIKDKQRRGRF